MTARPPCREDDFVHTLQLDARHSPSGCMWTLSSNGNQACHWEFVPSIPDFLAAISSSVLLGGVDSDRAELIEWFGDAMASQRAQSSCGLCWLDKRNASPRTLRGSLAAWWRDVTEMAGRG